MHETIKKIADLSPQKLALLRQRLKKEQAVPSTSPIPRQMADQDTFPLSFAQQRLWFLEQFETDSPVYTIPCALRLRGHLDVAALEASLGAIIRRHAALRTTFHAGEDQPYQRVAQSVAFHLPVDELQHLPQDERAAEVERRAYSEVRLPFALASGPLFRARLYRLSPIEHMLLVTMHHIVSDGWSIGVFVGELAALYRAHRSGLPDPLPELPIQYGDFALWQRAWLSGTLLEAHLAYWTKQLADAPTLQLATDHPRPAVQRFVGAQYITRLPPELSLSLSDFSRQQQVTLFMTLLAAFAVLLQRHSSQDDILVGTPIANRTRAQTEPLIGFFVNTLVLRVDLSGQPSFATLLQRLRETALQAYAHQDLPFERLVEALQPQRDLSRNPLVQVLFILQNAPMPKVESVDLEVEPIEINGGVARMDLTLTMTESPDGLITSFEYNTDLFRAETIERLAARFTTLLEAILRCPDQPIASLPLLPPAERRALLKAASAPSPALHNHILLPVAFLAQVARTPDALALLACDTALSFQALAQRALHLAAHLQAHAVAPEVPVALALVRSSDLPLAMLAVLLAGGAFLPLDLSQPPERLASLLADAQPALLLTHSALQDQLPSTSLPTLRLDQLAPAPPAPFTPALLHPQHPAYLLYTSGSTGTPKGVLVPHGQLAAFCAAMDQRIALSSHACWLALTSSSFDISLLELLWTLSRGVRVVLREETLSAASTPRSSQRVAPAAPRPLAFSLFYFASATQAPASEQYRLLLEGARFADSHDFQAVWTPERHFHAFGGLYPNPAVTSAALATITKRVHLRAGSVVAPLHQPIRIAEEWALVDQLSQGRVGVSLASGWHVDDFVLAPERYADRKQQLERSLTLLRALWRGEAVSLPNGAGVLTPVRLSPRPVQLELPLWLTAAGNPATFELAGRLGLNLLTHLLGQSLEELEANLARYRAARRAFGHTGEGQVTLMIHTFVGQEMEAVRRMVREPFRAYLRSSLDLIRGFAASQAEVELEGELSASDLEEVLDLAVERYLSSSGLFGTVASCLALVERLRGVGVDELACLIDFGVPVDAVLASLPHLDELRQLATRASKEAEGTRGVVEPQQPSIGMQIRQHGVTHLQCTPSLLRLLLAEGEGQALGQLEVLLVGGEAFPTDLAQAVRHHVQGTVLNMYGPTETTIWSSTQVVDETASATGDFVPLGRPIAGTQCYVVDGAGELAPLGVPGELYLGGAGVVRGYWQRPALTAERFVPDCFGAAVGARLYRTGDIARWSAAGQLAFLGRSDDQIKLRGHRIEPGEIEHVLRLHPDVRDVVVVARTNHGADPRLVAYLTVQRETPALLDELREQVRTALPAVMHPSAYMILDALPLTPNGKLNRRALPAPTELPDMTAEYAPPRSEVEAALVQAWCAVLGRARIGIHDNFFALGGDSILTIQAVARARQHGLYLTPRQIFQHQTIAELAAVVIQAPQTTRAPQGLIQGTLPLTPIQHWFFEQRLPEPHHYNQSLLLALRQPLDPAHIRSALLHLVQHHDALRLGFSPTDAGWQATFYPPPVEAPFVMQLLPDATLATLAAMGTQIQSSLDLAHGPLIRLALFQAPGTPGYLLWVIHHLVVDGISWRILLDDFQTVYAQLTQGRAVVSPLKTASFQDWSAALHEYARWDTLAAEWQYWCSVVDTPVPALPRSDRDGANTEASARRITKALSEAETRALLQEVPQAYQTQINDVLLTGLALAFQAWTGQEVIGIDLEGHGREGVIGELDVSRTVGWFTSLFPLRLRLLPGKQLGARLKAIKEQLRAIPQHGIGYGVAGYLHPEGTTLKNRAEVLFNYLGQFDPLADASPYFTLSPLEPGQARSPLGTRSHVLEVNSLITAGQLQIVWEYSANIHTEEAITWLAEEYLRALRDLIDHCLSPDAGGFTPSDVLEAALSQAEIDSLLDRIAALEPDGRTAKRHIAALYPLSPIQQGMLFHTLYEPHTGMYFGQVSWRLHGALDLAAFRQAWQHVLDHHTVLRTLFLWEGLEQPLQIVLKQVDLPWEVQDWRQLNEETQQQQLHSLLQADRARGFELSKAPLMRITILHLDDTIYHCVWSYHIMLLDGWSIPLMFDEVLRSYIAHASRAAPQLSSPVPYRSYIAWLRQQDPSKAEPFWRDALRGFTEPTTLLTLPESGTQHPGEDYGVLELRLSQSLTEALQALAREHQLTINTILQGAWAILLSRYTDKMDVVFGATVSGRSAPIDEIERMPGVFINTLPVRIRMSAGDSLIPWLQQIQGQQAETRLYEFIPLTNIQRWSELAQGTALFETLLVVKNYINHGSLQQDDIGLRILDFQMFERVNYPLCVVVEIGPQLALTFSHEKRRFSEAFIQRLSAHLHQILMQFVADPDQCPQRVPILSEDERHLLLVEWNATARAYPLDRVLTAWIADQVARTPDATAVVFDGSTTALNSQFSILNSQFSSMTYRELLGRANQLAHHLQQLGVGPNNIVGVCVERSLDLVVALLGVLQAGAAYLPLDPSYPDERLAFMYADAQPHALLTHSQLLADWMHDPVVCLDRDWPAIAVQPATVPALQLSPDHLAYLIYTSGSTGRPKGVAIPHRAILNRLLWMQQTYALGPSDRVLQKTPFSFDVSVWEFFWPLMSGASLVLARPHGQRDSSYLVECITRQQITTLHFVPSMLRAFLEHPTVSECRSLQRLICSGEELPYELQERCFALLGEVGLDNLYGPTEVAIDVTAWRCRPGDPAGVVPIGWPIANTQAYILDRHMQPVPIGVGGELYIGGVQLAQGYLGRPDLTAERFVPNPFTENKEPRTENREPRTENREPRTENQEPSSSAVGGRWSVVGGRLYRSGDLARYRLDGSIEFLGRADTQVKLRGFRIELGEIETALRHHPDIRDSAVVVYEDTRGIRQLVAYVVPTASDVKLDSLHDTLDRQLPDYMVPTVFVPIERLPLSINGKLDRRALPAPPFSSLEQDSVFVPPSSPIEQHIATLWGQLLQRDQISANDNFFTLGGDSLLATQMIGHVRAALSIDVPLPAIFDAPTLAAFAATVDRGISKEQQPIPITQRVAVASDQPAVVDVNRLSDQEVQEMLQKMLARRGPLEQG